MKCKIIIFLSLITVPLWGYAPQVKETMYIYEPTPVYYNIQHSILLATIKVESPKNAYQAQESYNREFALGKLQIRPIMIAEVNRILKFRKYKHSDALDSVKAVEIFMVYQNFHNPKWNAQRAAYLWVGGSNYMNATKEEWSRMHRYWLKIKKHLETS
jgi:hypothetical protein